MWQWIVMALIVYLLTYVFAVECWGQIAMMLLMSLVLSVSRYISGSPRTQASQATGGAVAWWLNSYVRHSLLGAGRCIVVCGLSAGDAAQRCGCHRWVAIYGRAVGWNSSARVPVDWACGSEYISLLGYLLCSVLACWRLVHVSLYTVYAVLVVVSSLSQSSGNELVSWTVRDVIGKCFAKRV